MRSFVRVDGTLPKDEGPPPLVIPWGEISIVHAEVVVNLQVLPIQLPGSRVEVVHRAPAARNHHVRCQRHPLGLARAHDVGVRAPRHLVRRHCTGHMRWLAVGFFCMAWLQLAVLLPTAGSFPLPHLQDSNLRHDIQWCRMEAEQPWSLCAGQQPLLTPQQESEPAA